MNCMRVRYAHDMHALQHSWAVCVQCRDTAAVTSVCCSLLFLTSLHTTCFALYHAYVVFTPITLAVLVPQGLHFLSADMLAASAGICCQGLLVCQIRARC
ncbi:hypothetical protein ABBQ38_002910 [Trebouxia sp. C0009 RCD-2024]